MKTTVIRLVVLLFIAGMVGLGCKTTPGANHAPTITALSLPDSVEAGNDASFSCTASDPDGDALSYSWTCSSGTLLSTNTRAVQWTAPAASGQVTVTVVVRDSFGASDTSSGTLAVKPIVATIIDWAGSVDARGFQVWHNYITTGYTVSGSFSAGVQFITFLVLDSIGYQNWGFHQPYTALVKDDSSLGTSFSAVVPQTGLYHIILDNTKSGSADTTVHLTVQTTSP